MNLWNWLSRRFPRGYRRGLTAELELGDAYRRVFSGHGTEADGQLVLTDLANSTGFYRVNGPEVDATARTFGDGQRAVYGRIFRFLRMTDQERRSLEEAARQEALSDVEEGVI